MEDGEEMKYLLLGYILNSISAIVIMVNARNDGEKTVGLIICSMAVIPFSLFIILFSTYILVVTSSFKNRGMVKR